MEGENQPEAQAEPTKTEPTQAPTQAAEATPEPQQQKAADEPKRTLRAELRSALRSKDDTKVEAEKRPEPVKAESAQPEPVEPILPPADMTPDEREAFKKLDPAAQRYLSRRAYETRSTFTKKTEAIAAREREIEQLAGVNLGGIREEYAKHGIPLPTVIENAVAWDRAFRANPKAAALEYLQSWGINPAELSDAAPAQQQHVVPTDIERIVQERLEARLQEEQQKVAIRNNYQAVESFQKSKPLFKDPGTAAQLEAAMDPFVRVAVMQNPSRPASEILEEAYSKVINSDPQFRELQQKFDGRAAADKARAEAEAAMQASRSVSGGPGSGTPNIKPKSLRDALRLGIQGQLPRAG